jgi:hypothetical protein
LGPGYAAIPFASSLGGSAAAGHQNCGSR